jgi:hypothetical protein
LGTLKVFGEVALQRVVAGHFVEFATLLVEPHPQPPLLVEDVLSLSMAARRKCSMRSRALRPEPSMRAVGRP